MAVGVLENKLLPGVELYVSAKVFGSVFTCLNVWNIKKSFGNSRSSIQLKYREVTIFPVRLALLPSLSRRNRRHGRKSSDPSRFLTRIELHVGDSARKECVRRAVRLIGVGVPVWCPPQVCVFGRGHCGRGGGRPSLSSPAALSVTT